MDLNKLQQLWDTQSHTVPTTIAEADVQTSELIRRIAAIEDRLRRTVRRMTIVTTLMIIYLAVLWFNLDAVQPVTTLGYVLVVLVMVFYTYTQWANRVDIRTQGTATPTVQFLNYARRQYRFRKRLAYVGVFVYGVLISLAIVLGTLQFVSRMNLSTQWILYGLTLAWTTFSTILMYRRQTHHYQKNIAPLLTTIHRLLTHLRK